MKDLIGKEKYFVHKGTWKNDYEWHIQKITVTGLKIDKENKVYAEFSFNSCGYEYPADWLRDTLTQAKKFAIEQIKTEKKRQIKQIYNITELA